MALSPGGVSPGDCAPEFANVVVLLFAFCLTEKANKPTPPACSHHLHCGRINVDAGGCFASEKNEC